MDISALKKFQEVWGPVLEAIPTVIDATQNKTDLERAVAIKRQEFEKIQLDIATENARLADVRASFAGEVEKIKQEAEAEISAVRADIEATKDECKKAKAAVAKSKKDAVEIIAMAESEGAAKASVLIEAAKMEVSAFEEQVALLKKEVIALSEQKEQADKALESLRAKLGV